MKLSKVYANDERLFKPIRFNGGLNVIYAKVTRPKESDKDSHNLGKTLLAHLLDFMLLKRLDKGHFLYDNKDRFAGVVFFLEIKLNDGGYVTVRRSVDRNTKIALVRHADPDQNLAGLEDGRWDDVDVSFDRAREKLNGLLSLTAIAPWQYRKGISYFLRTQKDYSDVFQIGKFAKGSHSEWKPYIAALLGFSGDLIGRKYEIEKEIEKKKAFRDEAERELQANPEAYDRIKGTIEIKRSEIAEMRQQVDRFNFFKHELASNTQLVEDIERRSAECNDRLYTLGFEQQKIEASISTKITFDLKRVQEVFAETQIHFKDDLRRSYEELLAFNRRLSAERSSRLQERLSQVQQERAIVEKELAELNRRREEALAFLQERDTFAKFKAVQAGIVRWEADVARLETELEYIDKVSKIDKELRDLNGELEATATRIVEAVNRGNPTYSSVRTRFNKIIKDVLGVPALLSITPNRMGNLDFEATILHDEVTMSVTSEGKGTSYKKLLCAAFDMAVLEAYAGQPFYRFVYHDGVLEGLDNRKKQRYLKVVSEFCGHYGLQYVLTVIDADLPRDTNDVKQQFPSEVVVRELWEGSDEGRLFNMPKF